MLAASDVTMVSFWVIFDVWCVPQVSIGFNTVLCISSLFQLSSAKEDTGMVFAEIQSEHCNRILSVSRFYFRSMILHYLPFT